MHAAALRARPAERRLGLDCAPGPADGGHGRRAAQRAAAPRPQRSAIGPAPARPGWVAPRRDSWRARAERHGHPVEAAEVVQRQQRRLARHGWKGLQRAHAAGQGPLGLVAQGGAVCRTVAQLSPAERAEPGVNIVAKPSLDHRRKEVRGQRLPEAGDDRRHARQSLPVDGRKPRRNAACLAVPAPSRCAVCPCEHARHLRRPGALQRRDGRGQASHRR
mmetsp:Transcript_10087/g.39300  ORF Transcript_10087/g.39300 Transcript_10087/m.39300 type:complete len:219 (+) Transcript_10087:683-1339(+)